MWTFPIKSGGGTVLERYQYESYGSVSYLNADWSGRASSAYAWIYLHQGGRFDGNSGLYHFRNRDYSPSLGRWMQQDSAGYIDGMSLYEYLSANPIGNNDPQGFYKTPTFKDCTPKYGSTIKKNLGEAENMAKAVSILKPTRKTWKNEHWRTWFGLFDQQRATELEYVLLRNASIRRII